MSGTCIYLVSDIYILLDYDGDDNEITTAITKMMIMAIMIIKFKV